MNAAQLRRVTVEGFAHYQQGLYELLEDAVRQGASIGFLDDFDRAQGIAYLSELKGQLESQERLLWVVVRNEQVLASVQLAPCGKANGRHRAEVQKLLVHREFQRHGLATQLMGGAEQAARQKGLSLLYLDTEARSPLKPSTRPPATPAWGNPRLRRPPRRYADQHRSLLQTPSRIARMIPGQYQIQPGEIELNVGRRTLSLSVANSGDRPIQVGSHYHFFETNDALTFDRAASRGMRLNIPAGTAVRFEPGQSREVELVDLAGLRKVYGFAGRIMGDL